MNLFELQVILGERIEKLTDESFTKEQRKEEIVRSTAICNIAKQMINNADVIIRAEKLSLENGIGMNILGDKDV